MTAPNRVSYGELIPRSANPRVYATVYDRDGNIVRSDDPALTARAEPPPQRPEPPIVVKAKPVTNLPGMKNEAKEKNAELKEKRRKLHMKSSLLMILQYIVWGSAIAAGLLATVEYRGEHVIYGAQRFHSVDCARRSKTLKRVQRSIDPGARVVLGDTHEQTLGNMTTTCPSQACACDESIEACYDGFMRKMYSGSYTAYPSNAKRRASKQDTYELRYGCDHTINSTQIALGALLILNYEDHGTLINDNTFRLSIGEKSHHKKCFNIEYSADNKFHNTSMIYNRIHAAENREMNRTRRSVENASESATSTSTTPKPKAECETTEFIPWEKALYDDFIAKLGENFSILSLLEVLLSIALYVMRKNTRLEIKETSRKMKENTLVMSYKKNGENGDMRDDLKRLLHNMLDSDDRE